MARYALDIGYQANPARVFFIFGIIEPDFVWKFACIYHDCWESVEFGSYKLVKLLIYLFIIIILIQIFVEYITQHSVIEGCVGGFDPPETGKAIARPG
jgi:hypothetical protein